MMAPTPEMCMCGNRAKVPRDDVYTAPPHHRHFLHFYVMGVLGWLYPLGHPRINLEYSVLPAWQLSLAMCRALALYLLVP